MKTIEFRAMGCQMAATLDADSQKADRLLAQTPEWFDIWEACLSRFRPESELSRLNRQAAQADESLPPGAIPVSPLLEEVLRAALEAGNASHGLVTPAVLNAMLQAGYDRSFAEIRPFEASPAVNGAARVLPAPLDAPLSIREIAEPADLHHPSADRQLLHSLTDLPVHLDELAHTVHLAPGTGLDLGGIAKGWAADQAALLLAQAGPCLVDAGGDLAASGPKANGEPWGISVVDPFNPDLELDMALLFQGGIATSGRDYRRWQKDGAWQHHIIDPRTGRPAATDLMQVTVVASSAQAAEMAAKTALILGSQAGLAWLDQHPEYAGLLIGEDGARYPSRRWTEHIWSEA
jgi:FAD:protein FMN transferase